MVVVPFHIGGTIPCRPRSIILTFGTTIPYHIILQLPPPSLGLATFADDVQALCFHDAHNRKAATSLFILHPCRSRTLVVPTIRRRKVPSFPGQLQYQAHQVVDKEVRVPRVHGHLVAQVCHSCLLTPIVSPFVDPSPSAKSSLPTCAKSIQVNFHSIHSLRFRTVEEKQYDGRNQDF